MKRKGGASGIDGVTIESFEKNLFEEITRLNQEVESWSYQPSPVRKVEIAKALGGVRGWIFLQSETEFYRFKAVLEPNL